MKKMSFTVNGSECGLMYKKGKLAAVLGPGKYSTLGSREYSSMSSDSDIIALTGCTADALRKADGADSITITDVADRTIALHYVDGHFVGAHTLDEILENKKDMGRAVLGELTVKAKDLYIDIKSADVKDIILPGEIRDIMNSVLAAEKQAQANVITRREEVASTRSLLNTAKLMEENATLYKLKELEYVEKICRNVGNINVTGGDMLSQLTEILRGHKEN